MPEIKNNTTTTNTVAPAPKRSNHSGRKLRSLLPYVGALAVIAAIVAGLRPQPAAVETSRVTKGSLRVTVNEEGKTRIRERHIISAPVTGHLRRLPLKAGADIEAGKTIIAVIEPMQPLPLDARSRAMAEARRNSASANLEKARAAHAYAASELRRVEKLFAEKTVSVQELEAAQWRETNASKEKAAAESSELEVKVALAEYAISNTQTTAPSTTEITASTSGRILRVLQESAKVVTAGTPLVEIGDPADLEVVIEVLSRDAVAIQPGSKVIFEQWGGATPLTGRVRLAEPAAFTKVSALGVEEQRVNIIADIIEPPEHRKLLGDQFRVEARIVTWEAESTLKVPTGALFRKGDQWAGFVIEAGVARLRSVKIGQSNGIETQVLSGFNEGDEVILYPGDRIKPDLKVRPITL